MTAEQNGLEIPFERLSGPVLDRLIEEFVTREGTEYGEVDVSLEDKRRAVKRQLERGEAVIVFDQGSETTSIVPKA